MNGVGPEWFAEFRRYGITELFGKRVTRYGIRGKHAEGDHALTLQFVRDPYDRGFDDGFVGYQHGFHFGRAHALACNLQRVVAAAENVPLVVFIAHRPITVRPNVRPA